jgi:hypothetical protein
VRNVRIHLDWNNVNEVPKASPTAKKRGGGEGRDEFCPTGECKRFIQPATKDRQHANLEGENRAPSVKKCTSKGKLLKE